MAYVGRLDGFARLSVLAVLLFVILNQPGSGTTITAMPKGAATATGANTAGRPFTSATGRGEARQRFTPPAPDPASAKLVRATDLIYQGAFKLPHGPIADSSFEYGGTALEFNSARGSLLMVGHDWQQQVTEVTVPTIRPGAGWSDLPIATVLQPFSDATEGRMRSVANDPSIPVKVGGLLAYQGKLYLTGYVYYDASGSQVLSHFVSGLDLSVKGDVLGPFQVGKLGAGLVSGYFGLVPPEWQDMLGGPVLNGQCCLSIITRTSFGPAAFAIDPTKLGTTKPLPAVPLLYYTAAHQLGPFAAQSALFNGATQMGGVVFPAGTRSVLFFGKQGLGPSCYGEGTSKQALAGTGPAADPFCFDPAEEAKGYHAFPYVSYVWAYDAVDLAAVKNGKRQPWDVKPYAVWKLDLPFPGSARILGAAYDPKTGRIFLSQAYGDAAYPLIHVFSVPG